MATITEQPNLRDYEVGALLLRDSDGNATKITSGNGKRVLWEPDNHLT